MTNFHISRPEVDRSLNKFTRGSNNVLLLTGAAGSGKTTVLRTYIDKYSKKGIFHKIIFIPGHSIGSVDDLKLLILKETNFKKWKYWSNKDRGTMEDTLKDVLRRTRILLVIDGVDEVIDEQSRLIYDYLNTLGSLMNEDSKLILSARNYSKGQIEKIYAKGYEYLHLNPISEKEIQDLIKRTLKEIGGKTNSEEFERISNLLISRIDGVTPELVEFLLKVGGDFESILGTNSLDDIDSDGVLKKLISIFWMKITVQSREFIRALLLFEDLVTIEKLSILLDIEDEKFLDSINELKFFGVVNITGDIVSFSHKSIAEGLIKLLEEERNDFGNTLDIYVDLNYVDKEQVIELLRVLNDVYQSIGGDELTITESGINQLNHCPVHVGV